MHPYEPFSSAKGFEGKVLLVRGTEDKLVSEEDCRKYMEVYGENCIFVAIEGGNHNFASIPARRALENALIEFLGGQK